MRRYLLAGGTLLGTLFVATAVAYAGLGTGGHVRGSWHLSPRHAAHPAASQDVSGTTKTPLSVKLLLVPENLSGALHRGISAEVSSNEKANGIAYVSIPRGAAKQAGLKLGRGTSVVIGQGTVAQVTDGTVTLRMKLARAIVSKLERLQHLALTLQLRLVAATGRHLWVGVIGRY